MKASTRAVLLVAAVFVVGAVGGVVGSRMVIWNLTPPWEEREEFPVPPGGEVLPGPDSEGFRRGPGQGDRRPALPARPGQRPPKDMLGRMIRQLELDDGQSVQVRGILQTSRQQQVEAGHGHQLRIRELRRQTLENIRSVLKPEQAQHLQRMLRCLEGHQRHNQKPRQFGVPPQQ